LEGCATEGRKVAYPREWEAITPGWPRWAGPTPRRDEFTGAVANLATHWYDQRRDG